MSGAESISLTVLDVHVLASAAILDGVDAVAPAVVVAVALAAADAVVLIAADAVALAVVVAVALAAAGVGSNLLDLVDLIYVV